MTRPIFIGDEVTAAGYRLAGLEVRVPVPTETVSILQAARAAGPPLILLTAELAGYLDAGTLERVLVSARPPVELVTDAAGRVPAPDLAGRIRSQVGVGE